jgi:hypothetical protein
MATRLHSSPHLPSSGYTHRAWSAALSQPDHVYRRRVAPFPARAAFERGLKLPDRRVFWPADAIEWDARFRFAAMAAYLQLTEALPDRR